jgi:FKBP-type peptidyl-prolyl cis-trans isomerase FkpA
MITMKRNPLFSLVPLLSLLLLAPLVLASPQTAESAAKEPGAQVTPSGLVIRMLKEGSGESPAATDTVRVHYRGTFGDGREFDSSLKRGKPAEFPLNRVIPCWTEGVQRIKVGGKAKLTCPAEIAYGAKGTPGGPIPPHTTLFFDVELLAIVGR